MRVTSSDAKVTLFRNNDDRAETQATQIGRLIDISVGGCRVAFEPPHNNPLQLNESVSNCRIDLPPRMEIHSEVVVRHCHTRKDRVLICGLELITMHVTDRRRLEQFVQSLKRVGETTPA